MRIHDPQLTGSIQFLNPVVGGVTASLFGSSSYALTASYALNGGGGGGTPGGSTTQLQYNNGGTFGGVPVATYDGTTLRLTGSFSGSLVGTASIANSVVGGYVTSFNTRQGSVTLAATDISGLGASIISSSVLSAGAAQGQITNTINGVATTITATELGTSGNPRFNNITASIVSSSNGFTGSISASFLQGAINNTQLRNSSVTVGSTAIALGGTSTTITGLVSVNSTSLTASIVSSSQFTGSLFGTASLAITASYIRNLYISSSEIANSSPTINELWHDASNGKTYIRYKSGSNEIWLLQSDPTIDVTTSLQTLQEVTDLGSTTDNIVTITNTTNATDSGSGALIVSGGAGFRGDVWGKKFYGDGSGLTGITATYTETDTLQSVTTRGNETSTSLFIKSTQNSTAIGVGALRVSGGLSVELDINARNITSSLFGTSSWSINSRTASFVATSSWANNSITASYVTGSIFTSANPVLSASYALTASYALNGGGGSGVNVQDEGGASFSSTTLNFVGAGVTAANPGGGVATITIPGGGGDAFPFSGSAQITGSLGVTGSVVITGSLDITGSFQVLVSGTEGGAIHGNINNYLEFYVQNFSNGISASTDLVAYNDTGNKNQNYVDMGINSSGISSTYSFGKANDSYIYNTGGDLFIGNSTAFYQPTRTSQSLHLFANAPGTPDLTITGSRVGIQKSGSLNATLDVLGNVIISGALHITGSAAAELKVLGETQMTGSLQVTNGIVAQSVTASLFGTASWALNVVGGAGGGGGNTFATFSVAGQSNVTASVTNDTLTLVAGSGISITTNATAESITFNSTNTNNFTRGITIADPTNAENATIMFTTSSLTINRITSVIRGTAAPSVTYTLRYAASRSLTGTEVITGGTLVQSPFTGSALISSSGFTNPTVPGNNFIWLQTTAKTGTVNELFVQFQYT